MYSAVKEDEDGVCSDKRQGTPERCVRIALDRRPNNKPQKARNIRIVGTRAAMYHESGVELPHLPTQVEPPHPFL